MATLFTDNRAMLALFQRIGDVEVLSSQGQTVEIDIALSTEDDRALRETLRAAARGEVGGSGLDPA